MKIINYSKFECPLKNCFYCCSPFSSKEQIIDHFKCVLYEEILLFYDEFEYIQEKAEKAEINLPLFISENENDWASPFFFKWIDYRDIKDENDNLNNDNDVKINYDLFDSNSYNNFYYCYADENDRFQKGNLEILRIQMGISKLYKLYKLFYLVRSIFDFHQVIKKLSMKIYKMYHYMEYDLKYGFYPDDINGKPYFWLTFNENCLYTKKEIEVKKKIIEFH